MNASRTCYFLSDEVCGHFRIIPFALFNQIWRVFPTPARIDAFDVGREARLCHPGHGILAPDYVRLPSQYSISLGGKPEASSGDWPVAGCYVLRAPGVLFALQVSYDAAAEYAVAPHYRIYTHPASTLSLV